MSSRLNEVYRTMKKRCYNPHRKEYKYYGGRGITVCDEWYSPRKHRGWLAFKEWALKNGYKEGLTLDRIDANKGYSPDNCRWVTMKEQANNKRCTHFVSYKGRIQTLAQWCDELQLNYGKVFHRIYSRHWSVEKSFETK